MYSLLCDGTSPAPLVLFCFCTTTVARRTLPKKEPRCGSLCVMSLRDIARGACSCLLSQPTPNCCVTKHSMLRLDACACCLSFSLHRRQTTLSTDCALCSHSAELKLVVSRWRGARWRAAFTCSEQRLLTELALDPDLFSRTTPFAVLRRARAKPGAVDASRPF